MTIARTWQTAESTAFARKRERGRKALGESETEKRLFPNARPARRSYWPPTARKSSPHPEARPPQYEALEAAPASTRECAEWEAGLALKLHGARRLTIAAWPALKETNGAVVMMSGNSALFPKAPYAAVGTINAAIVALAKAFSDRGIADGRASE
jgi:NAD(P)-dependent dehydrogenase (short-subunit alcohol dehydrogenase family)